MNPRMEEGFKILQKLNEDVKSAVDARTKWLDENAESCQDFKIGDAVYDLEKLEKVGVVARMVRRNRGDATFDNSISLEILMSNGYPVSYNHGTREQVERSLNRKAMAIGVSR